MPTETHFLDSDHNFAEPDEADCMVVKDTDADGVLVDHTWYRIVPPEPDTIAAAQAEHRKRLLMIVGGTALVIGLVLGLIL